MSICAWLTTWVTTLVVLYSAPSLLVLEKDHAVNRIDSRRDRSDPRLGSRTSQSAPPEEPLERALYGPLREIRSVLWPLDERIERLPEFAADDPEKEIQQDRDAGSEARNTET